MFNFLRRSKPSPPRDRLSQQNAYEAEGVAAGLVGKTREDCPYSRTEQSEAWRFWVYGCDMARSESDMIASGLVTFSSTATDAKPFTVPVDQAIESGMWKPKWRRFESS